MKFITLTLEASGKPIWINAFNIMAYFERMNRGTTLIMVTEDYEYEVKESTSEISALMRV